jgi:hypothetical protein
MSLARIWASSSPELLKIVNLADPFHKTLEDGTKFEPVTTNVKEGSPACLLTGSIVVTLGAGKLIVCWHEASSIAAALTKSEIERRVGPFKFPTPESAGRCQRPKRNGRDY